MTVIWNMNDIMTGAELRGWAPHAPKPTSKKNKTGRRHNWKILKGAIWKTISEGVRMVDECYATGVPTMILVGGRARHCDPKNRYGLRVIYDQVAGWARRAMIHRVVEIYSTPAKAEP